MKKLMITAAAALCATVGFSEGISSSNCVGYQNNKVVLNNRSMRSAATFLKLGENPVDIKLSDIKQTVGDPGDLTLCTYDDNVTLQQQYQFFSTEATGGALPEGWYILDKNGDPDFEAGPQDFPIPAGQGFVIVSGNSNAVLQFPKAIADK